MSSERHNEFRRKLEYERWANARVFDAIQAPGVPRSAVRLMAHIQAARRIWLERIASGAYEGLDVFPDDDVQASRSLAHEMDARYETVLEGVQGSLEGVVRYRNTMGQEFATALGEILEHVRLHGAYHRGQIARVLREAGIDPPVTDYIAYVRESGMAGT
jgi:uncharacterized damage-inducible protein DinB